MSDTPLPRRLVTVAEAADYVRCEQQAIRRRITNGTLTAYRLGTRMVRIDMDELDAAFTVTRGTEAS